MASNSCQRLFMICADPGIDDAQAIMMALVRPDIKILAFNIHCGNTTGDYALRNGIRLLATCDKLSIPVHKGSSRSLVHQLEKGDNFHGVDGFGDCPDLTAPGTEIAMKEHAVLTMINLVNQYPGEITLVALGPLTDLALAHRLDPEFSKKLKDLYIMGGNYLGKGNITRAAEFNVFFDPESANIVLTEYLCDLYLFPWELCVDNGLHWDFHKSLRKMPGKKAELMRTIESKLIDGWKDMGPYVLADELAMAGAIDMKTVTEFSELSVEVELHGQKTRGQLIIDWRNMTKHPRKIQLVTKMDMEMVKDLIIKAYED